MRFFLFVLLASTFFTSFGIAEDQRAIEKWGDTLQVVIRNENGEFKTHGIAEGCLTNWFYFLCESPAFDCKDRKELVDATNNIHRFCTSGATTACVKHFIPSQCALNKLDCNTKHGAFQAIWHSAIGCSKVK